MPFSSSFRATGSGSPGELRVELLAGAEELEPLVVERRRGVAVDAPELLAVGVLGQHGEAGLRAAQRHLLAAEGDARGQDLVLERVLALGQLARDQPALAGLAQPVEPLALLVGGLGLGARAARRAARA